MAIAVEPRGERPYVLIGDRELPETQQTRWLIRDLTEGEMVRFMDSLRIDVSAASSTASGGGTRVYLTIKSALLGTVDGFPLRDSSGNPVIVTRDTDGRVSDEYLSRISWADKMELSNAIMSRTQLDTSDVEKSEPLSTVS